jgi:hypothetical protein
VWLQGKGIASIYLEFSDTAPEPTRNPRIPTDVRSEFLANRAMGDWAEDLLGSALRAQTDFNVSHYGESDTISAGEEGFKEFYLRRLADVRQWGKRPDLLLFRDSVLDDNVSAEPTGSLIEAAKQAAFSIEVRSSKVDAETYMQRRQEDYEKGIRGARMCPSFTVKVEDLIIVYRWLRHHAVPQYYAQVFFDSVYAISMLDIFSAIADGGAITIEKNANNQAKATIHIPITRGTQIAVIDPSPDFSVERRVTRLGRHDSFLKPSGGKLTLDIAALKTAGLV